LSMYTSQMIPGKFENRNHLLRNMNLAFPAWFRILLADADQKGYQELVDMYLEEARDEYAKDLGLRILLDELDCSDRLTARGPLSSLRGSVSPRRS
jgi:hypothetical protein